MEEICETCKHWSKDKEDERVGLCNIQLPPWVMRMQRDSGVSRYTMKWETCDLRCALPPAA